MREDQTRTEEIMETLAKELANLQHELDDFGPTKDKRQVRYLRSAITDKTQKALQVLVEERAQIQSNLRHWNSSKATAETQRDTAAEESQRLENDLKVNMGSKLSADRNRTGPTRRQCTLRNASTLIRQSSSWNASEKRPTRPSPRPRNGSCFDIRPCTELTLYSQGVRSEDIMPAYLAAKEKLAALKSDIRGLHTLHRVSQVVSREIGDLELTTRQTFELALRARRKWWTENRSLVAVNARTQFIVNLSNRNFEGRLDFDHAREKLAVRVSTLTTWTSLTHPKIKTTGAHIDETQDGPTQGRFKAPKNLSGGERSFSTVSLLLALWGTTSSPIRCLDEWDVFLDHVNRGIAAKMLVRRVDPRERGSS